MPDPEGAWEQLTGLLRPGGLMNIGLYSAAARQSITRLREHNARLARTGTPDEIRTFREEVLGGELAWARAELAEWRDFFTISGLRDLIFAALEDPFDVPRIERALSRCGLEFVGFAFRTDAVSSQYRRMFPESPETDLHHWHEFETQFPMTFTGMYSVYCQKIPAASA
jgi:hypothetical protein